MRALFAHRERQTALVWSVALMIVGVAWSGQHVDDRIRHELATLVSVMTLSPADYKVAEPVPALQSSVPLRTH